MNDVFFSSIFKIRYFTFYLKRKSLKILFRRIMIVNNDTV